MSTIDKSKFKELLGRTAEANAFVDSFTSEDLLILQLYYKWVTRKLAKNAGISSLITDEAEKQEIMRTFGAADWQFSGVVDYGEGASRTNTVVCARCSNSANGAGRGLRYAYYAYSPSLNKNLAFGKDCMSAFLKVDVSIMNKLERVLQETDNDVREALAYGRNSIKLRNSTCYTMLYALKTNPDLNHVFVGILGKTTTELFLNFMHSGFVLPKRLDTMVTNAYNQSVQEFIWNRDDLQLFGVSLKGIKNDYGAVTVTVPSVGSKVYEAGKITTDLPMDALCQLGLRQVINCLSINTYLRGVNFMSSDAALKQYFIFLQRLNILLDEKAEKLKAVTYASRTLLIQAHCSGAFENNPANVLLACLAQDDTAAFVTLFNIVESQWILGVLVQNMQAVLSMLEAL